MRKLRPILLNLMLFQSTFISCNVIKTSGKCNFVEGDGIGGSEQFVQKVSSANGCAELVKKTVMGANGASWGSPTRYVSDMESNGAKGSCYAKFNATGINDNTVHWKSCLFKDNPCSPSPCYNSGTCRLTDGDKEECSCAPGTMGKTCEENMIGYQAHPPVKDPCDGKVCGKTCVVGGDMAGQCNAKGECSFDYNNLGCVNGGLSTWSGWTPCTASCGGGEHSRTRKCDSPAPDPGGKDCEGALSETQACNANPCLKQEGEDCGPGPCFSPPNNDCGTCVPNLICGPVNPLLPDVPGTCGCIERGHHWLGEDRLFSHDLTELITETPEECQKKCRLEPKCRQFNWHDTDHPKGCFLFPFKGTLKVTFGGAKFGATGPQTCEDRFTKYEMVQNQQCKDGKYGAFSTVNEAVDACTKDVNCLSVYDKHCDDTGLFSLCEKSANLVKSASGACTYTKT